MSNPTWSFTELAEWLRARSDRLRGAGAKVDFQLQPVPRASARMRVERGNRLGELTIWDDGAAHMVVGDLASGDVVFERDGVSLASGTSEELLQQFFGNLDG